METRSKRINRDGDGDKAVPHRNRLEAQPLAEDDETDDVDLRDLNRACRTSSRESSTILIGLGRGGVESNLPNRETQKFPANDTLSRRLATTLRSPPLSAVPVSTSVTPYMIRLHSLDG
ncbi:hypothetical protein QE152_g38289 [Popillia japonica]|uniref:Uncharacterized protein n=1 Tax=Popillia japonica TaxID=7064 RepID=A0AAW1I7A3_POPJA